MLLVNHCIESSAIHGLGVFTREPIKAGSLVWIFDPMFDIEIPTSFIKYLSEADVLFVLNHAEYIEHLGVFRLGNDGDMFMNHSDIPSLLDLGNEMRAAHDISIGTELTCDYSQVCVLGFPKKLKNLARRFAA